MKHTDFAVGTLFYTCTGQWRCTDLGLRTILAIKLKPGLDESWFNGPPYVVVEVPFDECDIPRCYRNENEAIEYAIHEAHTSGHPGYPGEDVSRMFKEKWAHETAAKYPHEGLLRFDRVKENGELLHPYAARQSGDSWVICLYLPFLHEYAEIPEIDFLRLPIATKIDLKKRAKTDLTKQ